MSDSNFNDLKELYIQEGKDRRRLEEELAEFKRKHHKKVLALELQIQNMQKENNQLQIDLMETILEKTALQKRLIEKD